MVAEQKKRTKRARREEGKHASGNQSSRQTLKRRKTPKVKTAIEVRKLRFLKWELSSITAMAVSPDGSFLIAVRENGCMELRQSALNFTDTFVLHQKNVDESAAASCLAFDTSGKYLLVGRFNGLLDIYSVSAEGITPHVQLEPGGGAIMSIATHPNGLYEFAVACEDGCVRFISIDEQFVQVDTRGSGKTLLPTDSSHYSVNRTSPADGMALSLCWRSIENDADGLIVTGDSRGALRWIKGSTKTVIGRAAVPIEERDECRIWTVQIVADGRQVICGDSRGMVSIWCSNSRTKLEENQIELMAGDIWASALTLEGDGSENVLLGCAGGTIAAVSSLISANGTVSWIPTRGRPIHSHDIRSIGVVPDRGFVTASADSRMCFLTGRSLSLKSSIRYLYPFRGPAQQNNFQFIPKLNMVIARKVNDIDFWNLPPGRTEVPTLALRVNRPATYGKIVSCATSSDISLVAVSCVENFAVFRLSRNDTNSFTKVSSLSLPREVEKVFCGAVQMCFMRNSIYAITRDGQSVLELNGDRFERLTKKAIGSKAAFLAHIVCGPSGIAISDSRGCIFFAGLEQLSNSRSWGFSSFTRVVKMGSNKSVSCMQFSQNGSTLVAALLDRTIAVISPIEGDTNISTTDPFPSLPTALSYSSAENCVLVSGFNFCSVLSWKPRSIKKTTNLPVTTDLIARGTNIIGSGFSDDAQINIIERDWNTEFGQLPQMLSRKRFGT